MKRECCSKFLIKVPYERRVKREENKLTVRIDGDLCLKE